MKEKYETPDIEIVKLDAEIETTNMIKESNEMEIDPLMSNMDLY